MNISRHVVDVVQDQVLERCEQLRAILPSMDKETTSQAMSKFLQELMDSLISHFQREDRAKVMEGMARQYNLKMEDDNLSTHSMPIDTFFSQNLAYESIENHQSEKAPNLQFFDFPTAVDTAHTQNFDEVFATHQ